MKRRTLFASSLATASVAAASGFAKWGRLEHAESHYLKFRDGGHWPRGGVDSQGNAIVGAINYLASQNGNSICSMPLKIGGDGKDLGPFVGKPDPKQRGLDDGELGPERKLYCRELARRFGPNLALRWNLSEEYNIRFNLGHDRVRQVASNVQSINPYSHHSVFRSRPDGST